MARKPWTQCDTKTRNYLTAVFSVVDPYCMRRTHRVPSRAVLDHSYLHSVRGSISSQSAVNRDIRRKPSECWRWCASETRPRPRRSSAPSPAKRSSRSYLLVVAPRYTVEERRLRRIDLENHSHSVCHRCTRTTTPSEIFRIEGYALLTLLAWIRHAIEPRKP